MTDVVVVESPAKAKTINKYLGGGFTVLASFGHVRDLPPKDGSVRPDEGFAMDWAADERGNRQVTAIAKALKGADRLWLATDPDREGEAISWHVRAMLEEKKALKGVEVQRITFNEITKSAVQYAMAHPRELDQPLIEAYLARRALDYLVGFTLSPVLWRKLPGSRSAGRVQSVALRLVCEREAEIEAFRAREYWTVEAHFTTPSGAPFTARLTHLDGKRLDQFDLNDADKAAAAKAAVEAGQFSVASVERRRVKRNPQPPFTTSSFQMDASRKLGLGAQAAMRVAQQLYEGVDIGGETVGLISYMRTDGVQMAQGGDRRHPRARQPCLRARVPARRAAGIHVQGEERAGGPRGDPPDRRGPRARRHGALSQRRAAPRLRPDLEARRGQPDAVGRAGPGGGRRRLAAARTCAPTAPSWRSTASSSCIARRPTRRPRATAATRRACCRRWHERDPLRRDKTAAEQHFTQPPPRFSEASLVKRMEELGIGRPSTYASILETLRNRNYVRLESRRLFPEDRGRLVTAFLTSLLRALRGHGVHRRAGGAAGRRVRRPGRLARGDGAVLARLLATRWKPTRELKISDVIDALDHDLGEHFFPAREDGSDPRVCPVCHTGRLGLKLGRHGSFIGCSNYPACQYTRRLAIDGATRATR